MKRSAERDRRLRRRYATLVAGVAASTVVMLSPAAPGLAQVMLCSSFDTVAAADGVRKDVFVPGQFIVEQADVQGPAAQAAAAASGISTAYAGAPYPGDAAVSGVALAGADPNAVPTYVATQYPTNPSADRSTPATTLKAASARTVSTASATGGGGSDDQGSAGKTTSTARAGCDDAGAITADATTDSEAAAFADGTLRLGRVSSRASAKVGKGGETVLSSDLVTGQFAVVGQTVALTDKGLTTPRGTTPLVANPLAEALEDRGLAVTYVAEERDPDGRGITAPGVKVTITQDTGGTAPSVVTYTFGRARARASGEPSSATGPTVGDSVDPAAAGRSFGTDDGLAAAPDLDKSGPELAGSDTSASAVDTTEGQEPALAQPASGRVDTAALSLANIYLALVVGAVAVFAGGSLLRVIGVKLAWT